MFKHIFVTRIKCLIRDKQLVFWSLTFPLVLATLFKVAFANLSTNEIFKVINVAVVADENYENNHGFKGAMEAVSGKGTDKLFNVTFTDERHAEELLKNNEVAGYIYLNPEINLVVKSSGLNETVIKAFLNNYKQGESTIASVIKSNPEAAGADLIHDVFNYKEYTKEVSASKASPDTTLNYFYALIALACLYGGFLGLKEVSDIQGDLSKRAARVNMAPVHKIKVFVYGFLAALTIQFVEIIVLLVYLNLALGVHFGNQLPYILLLCLVECMAGVSMGTMVSACIKKNEGMKIGIMITLSTVGCALAGMYYANLKYIIEQHVPLMAYINPASLITDGFYSLYYYSSHGRFFVNAAMLAVISIIFCSITYLIIRRERYASL